MDEVICSTQYLNKIGVHKVNIYRSLRVNRFDCLVVTEALGVSSRYFLNQTFTLAGCTSSILHFSSSNFASPDTFPYLRAQRQYILKGFCVINLHQFTFLHYIYYCICTNFQASLFALKRTKRYPLHYDTTSKLSKTWHHAHKK